MRYNSLGSLALIAMGVYQGGKIVYGYIKRVEERNSATAAASQANVDAYKSWAAEAGARASSGKKTDTKTVLGAAAALGALLLTIRG